MNNLDYISTAVDEFSRFFLVVIVQLLELRCKIDKIQRYFFLPSLWLLSADFDFFFVVFGSIYTREIFKIILQSTVRVEFL